MVGRRSRGGGGRGRRSAVRRWISSSRNEGHFSSPPMDPPSAFKSGWKAIRLEEALGSTSVTVTLGNIRDALTTLGISANAIKLMKIAVWVTPGVQANAALPQVVLSILDPIGRGTLGTRVDTGQLSRAAKVSYSFSDTVRETSLDLPTAGTAGAAFAAIESSAGTGVFQVSLIYNI